MFKNGFEKIALSDTARKALAVGGIGAYVGGVGALSGHVSHVHKKIIHARAGKEYKEKSFIDKHPKLTGALSLGLAPAASAALHQKELDLKNSKVRKVLKDHPFVAGDQ
jgi:hypothetical protein